MLFLNHFMLDPQRWYRHKAAVLLLRSAFETLPALLYIFREDWHLALCLLPMRLLAAEASDALYLRLFDRGVRIPGRMKRSAALIALSLAVYALSGLIRFQVRFGAAAMVFAGLSALAACALFAGILRYPRYKAVAVRYASANKALLSVRVLKGSDMNDVYLQDTPPEACRAQYEKNASLGAWQYFDRIFRLRFSKAARGHMRQTALFNTAFAVVAGLIFRYHAFGLDARNIMDYSSFAITNVIGMTWAYTFLELCYLNMDAPLLYHRFYDAGTIRLSVVQRFRHLLKQAGLMFLLAAADLILLFLIAGAALTLRQIVPIIAVFALLLYSFETLHLSAYYLLQPYTRDCTVKSPLFVALNAVKGLLTYGILLVRGDMGVLLVPMAGLALIATACFFAAVRFSPKTFALR